MSKSKFTTKTTGLDAAEALQRDLARTRPLAVSVTCKASKGRSAGDNVVILRTQATKGRNVIFLDKQEEAAGTKLWTDAIDDVTSGRTKMRPLEDGASAVGTLMVEAIRLHVQQGRRERGRVKSLAESTIKRKERETGRKNLPALVRTGALMDSLTPVVERL